MSALEYNALLGDKMLLVSTIQKHVENMFMRMTEMHTEKEGTNMEAIEMSKTGPSRWCGITPGVWTGAPVLNGMHTPHPVIPAGG